MLEPTIPIVKQGYLAYSFNTIARTVRILDPYSNQGSIPCKSGPRAFGRHKRLRLCSFRQRTLRELRILRHLQHENLMQVGFLQGPRCTQRPGLAKDRLIVRLLWTRLGNLWHSAKSTIGTTKFRGHVLSI